MDFIRKRFEDFSAHTIKVYNETLEEWEKKVWEDGCKDIEKMTKVLRAVKPEPLDIRELSPHPHCLAGWEGTRLKMHRIEQINTYQQP